MPNMSISPTTAALPSRLLALPFELRELIFKYALTGLLIVLNSSLRTEPHGIAVSLLATCSQIHQEATPLLYRSNIFLVNIHERGLEKTTDLPRSLSHILPKIQHALVVSHLDIHSFPMVMGIKLVGNLKNLTSLKTLRVRSMVPRFCK